VENKYVLRPSKNYLNQHLIHEQKINDNEDNNQQNNFIIDATIANEAPQLSVVDHQNEIARVFQMVTLDIHIVSLQFVGKW